MNALTAAASSTPSPPALSLTKVVAERGGAPVFGPLDLSVPAGAHGLVLGPSGCGKTTLLHMAAGVLQPSRGRVVCAGQDWAKLSPPQRDKARAGRIGLVLQVPRLPASLSLGVSLRLAAGLAGAPADAATAQDLLERVGLGHKGAAKPRDLSRGEVQRAAIAQVLALEPEVLLADEPTSALDDANTDRVCALLMAEAERLGAALIIATHDQRLKDKLPVFLEMGAA